MTKASRGGQSLMTAATGGNRRSRLFRLLHQKPLPIGVVVSSSGISAEVGVNHDGAVVVTRVHIDDPTNISAGGIHDHALHGGCNGGVDHARREHDGLRGLTLDAVGDLRGRGEEVTAAAGAVPALVQGSGALAPSLEGCVPAGRGTVHARAAALR
mmetsp:Transcript_6475/g.19186  ORF Transcript_6475/g.19186 Transcript_6475/m.19186 type:complete len:156 (-) Transcript_6475:688-1155(-)